MSQSDLFNLCRKHFETKKKHVAEKLNELLLITTRQKRVHKLKLRKCELTNNNINNTNDIPKTENSAKMYAVICPICTLEWIACLSLKPYRIFQHFHLNWIFFNTHILAHRTQHFQWVFVNNNCITQNRK